MWPLTRRQTVIMAGTDGGPVGSDPDGPAAFPGRAGAQEAQTTYAVLVEELLLNRAVQLVAWFVEELTFDG